MATLVAAWHRGGHSDLRNLNRMVEKHDIVRPSCHLDLLISAVQATSGIFADYMLWSSNQLEGVKDIVHTFDYPTEEQRLLLSINECSNSVHGQAQVRQCLL